MPPKIAQKPRKASPKREGKLPALLRFDQVLQRSSVPTCLALVGLDEVGRGSLIGPVVAAAVSLPSKLTAGQKRLLKWLDDSKKLNREIRRDLAAEIQGFCLVGVGEASQAEIDTINIHHASLLAMERAFQAMAQSSLAFTLEQTLLLVDGRHRIPTFPAEVQQTIIGGDGLSASIAAASIVAKHTRDSLILGLAEAHPQYGWEQNMGYGTSVHLQAIQQFGPTPYHRTSFKLG